MYASRGDDKHVEYLMALKLTQPTPQHINVRRIPNLPLTRCREKTTAMASVGQKSLATILLPQLCQILTHFQNSVTIK